MKCDKFIGTVVPTNRRRIRRFRRPKDTKLVVMLVLLFVNVTMLQPGTAQTTDRQYTAAEIRELHEVVDQRKQSLKHFQEGRYRETLQLERKIYQTQARIHGSSHSETAMTLHIMGMACMNQGDYPAAESYFRRALAVREKVLGEKDAQTVISISVLASVYDHQSKPNLARPLHQRAIRISESVFGKDHAETASAVNLFAIHSYQTGDLATAESLYRRVLKIREKVFGTDHVEVAPTLNNLALLLDSQGRYIDSEPLYNRALSISEVRHGKEHPETATNLNNLGLHHNLRGNYEEAIEYLQKALAINVKVVGEKHPATAFQLANLGHSYSGLKDYSTARSYLQRSLRIRRQLLDPNHPDIATTVSGLATVEAFEGNYPAADRLFRQARDIDKRRANVKHPDSATTLANIGLLRRAQGDSAAAQKLLQEARKTAEETLGSRHTETIRCVRHLAVLADVANRQNEARQLMDEMQRQLHSQMSEILPGLSEREQELLIESSFKPAFSTALSYGLKHADVASAVELSATWLLNAKGISHEALAQRNLLARETGDPGLARVVDEIVSVRRKLAQIAITVPAEGREGIRQEQLKKLTQQERQLARKLYAAARDSAEVSTWTEHDALRPALGSEAVFVDIARFQPYDFQAADFSPDGKSGPARYVAWVTHSDPAKPVVIVDLGDAAGIDELVKNVRRQMQVGASKQQSDTDEEEAVQNVSVHLAALGNAIWQPLVGHIGNAESVVLSPDGMLWLAPWAALPATGDDSHKYLVEDFELRFVTSGRDLVSSAAPNPGNPCVIFANPEFDQRADDKRSAIRAIFRSLPTRNDSASQDILSRNLLPRVALLPNTELEAVAIQSDIESYTGMESTIYRKRYALEQVAKSLKGPKVAAFATHGFFLSNGTSEDGSSATVARSKENLVGNPLLRCGLLLAGCNHRNSTVGDDDGILTGMEIVGIDLRGTGNGCAKCL